MPRKGRAIKRKIAPDPVYNSVLIQKFINKIMFGGKKSIAERIVYTSVKAASDKLKVQPLEMFEKVIENTRPLMEVKPRRVGGSTYQVPVEVEKQRGIALSMNWVRDFAKVRGGRSMAEKLSAEIIDAYNGGGGAIKKREDVHKVAESNKAFAHFRW